MTPVFEDKAAVLQRPEGPRAIEPEEQAAMAVSVFETMQLRARDMAELERETAVAELQHEPPMAELTEVPRLEVALLPEEAAMVEPGAMMRAMKFCACVRCEMAETKAAIASLGRLRRHRQRRQHCCQDHAPAHRLAP